MTRLIFTVWMLFPAVVLADAATKVDLAEPALRRPSDLIWVDNDQTLLVANRKSGTISVVDPASESVVGEWKLGQSLVQLVQLTESQFLVVDETGQELILVRWANGQMDLVARTSLPYSPLRAVADANQDHVYVTCKWPRKLVAIELNQSSFGSQKELTLPFAPRELVLVQNDAMLLVADNFQGNLAVVNTNAFEIAHLRQFPAHNIRAMQVSVDGAQVVFAHQLLNSLAVTNSNDIHWGLLMSNELRWLPVDRILEPQGDFYKDGFMHPIGEPGRGGGDPSDIAILGDDQAVVAMGGTGQIAVGRDRAFGLFRSEVGQGPSALAVSPDQQKVFVANQFDDTISIVDMKKSREVSVIHLGKRRELNSVERGEQLFFDAKLSMEGWMSCHSCHTDGHTNGLANDNFSDNSFGAPKRVPTLLGKKDTAPFGWLAMNSTLEQQIEKSILRTMQGGKLSDQQTRDLVAYLETLPVPPSIDRLQGTADKQKIARGRLIFLQNNCVKCHAPPTFTTPRKYDVGLHDKELNKAFNPPSLRGIGHRDTFFHDARATNLRDVFEIHGHQLRQELKPEQLQDLLAFLRSL